MLPSNSRDLSKRGVVVSRNPLRNFFIRLIPLLLLLWYTYSSVTQLEEEHERLSGFFTCDEISAQIGSVSDGGVASSVSSHAQSIRRRSHTYLSSSSREPWAAASAALRRGA